MEPATAIIAAAGSGERLGAGEPKALVEVAGEPMAAWSIRALSACPRIERVVIAAPPNHESRLAEIARAAAAPRDGLEIEVLGGGATRSQSVAAALERVESATVAIHDAARPLLTTAIVEAVLDALDSEPEASGAIAARRVADTIKLANGPQAPHAPESRPRAAEVERTIPRDRLWAAQTPQAFHASALREALAARPATDRGPEATDEAMVVEAAGGRVLLVEAGSENLKVTTAVDLDVAGSILAARRPSPGGASGAA